MGKFWSLRDFWMLTVPAIILAKMTFRQQETIAHGGMVGELPGLDSMVRRALRPPR